MDGVYRSDRESPSLGRSACIVMVCADDEAEQVARQLAEQDQGCLITYRRVEDLVLNAPTGKVALVVLSDSGKAGCSRGTLKWLRSRYPRCPITVVGDTGGGSAERAARESGAMFLTRPMHQEHVSEIVSSVIRGSNKRAKQIEDSPESK